MSRAAWAGILLLGAGLGLAAFFLTRGIESSTLDAVKAAEEAVAGYEQSLGDARDEFAELVKQAPEFLEGQGEIKAARKSFAQREAQLAEARAVLTEQIPPLVDSGDYENNARVVALAQDAVTKASQAVAGVAANAGTARTLLRYKTEHPTLMETARRAVEEANGVVADPALQSQIELSATSYPEARAVLDKQLVAMRSHAVQMSKSGARLDELRQASPVDFVATGKVADAIIQGRDELDKMRADLTGDIAQLGTSVDKILDDMKEENGRYYHKLRIIENGVSRTTDWQEVTRGVYQQHKDHLGMTIYSKPEGKLASEAETVAAPPGYNYVGNERYGRWEQRGGQSVWVFYGKYALMRDLLWGSGRYRPVYRNNYQSYRSTVRSGKPFYGATKQYGTKGSLTKTRYAGSNYYKQQRATTYSSSKYSGSGSGGRRSGGSRGSRYRSSSFGGGGK